MEEWRWVVGYEGAYEVSSLGEVRSVLRLCPTASGYRTVPARVLIQNTRGRYPFVTLYRNGPRNALIHRLVAEAFLGPCPAGMEVRHGPGGRSDNSVQNLSYGTHKENCADKTRDGTHQYGRGIGTAKLSPDQVHEIRSMSDAGTPALQVARRFGVSESNVKLIRARKSWSWLEER